MVSRVAVGSLIALNAGLKPAAVHEELELCQDIDTTAKGLRKNQVTGESSSSCARG